MKIEVPAAKNYFGAAMPFLAYASQWGKGNIPSDKCSSLILIDDTKFPNSTVFEESWPEDGSVNVKAFSAVFWNKPHGTAPKVLYPSVRIWDIHTLRVQQKVSKTGDCNAIIDYFLSKTPFGNDAKIELMFFMNPSQSARDWVKKGKLIDSWAAGESYLMWDGKESSNKIFVHMPKAGGTWESMTFDLNGSMRRLISLGQLTGNEYFNGFGIGIEAITGKSRVVLEQLKVAFSVSPPPIVYSTF